MTTFTLVAQVGPCEEVIGSKIIHATAIQVKPGTPAEVIGTSIETETRLQAQAAVPFTRISIGLA